MNKKIRLLILFISLFFLSACQKDFDIFTPDAGVVFAPDTSWQNIITPQMSVVSLKNDLRIPYVEDNFAFNNSGIVYNASNLGLSIPANSLVTPFGIYPVGNIERRSLLLQKKGDFIAMSMPTVSNGRLMISGGAFFLNLKNSNNELSVAPGKKLEVKYSTALKDSALRVFHGTDDLNAGFDWIPATEPNLNYSVTSVSGYEVFTNKLQWVHAGRIIDTIGIQQTVFSLRLPANFTNTNTVAYISFNNTTSVAGTYANINTRNFISASLPVNKSVTIIVISKQAGDYYLGSQQTTTSAVSSGSGIQEIVVTPVKTSLPSIKAYLATL